MANAWTRDADAGLMNAPPLLGGFCCSGYLIPPFAPGPRPAILLICEQLFGQASRVRTAAAHPRSDETNPKQTPSLETEFFGQRLSAEFDRKRQTSAQNRCRRPYSATLTLYNVLRFRNGGNRRRSWGLPGGGCRDRTDGHRSLASLQNEAARRGFRARNDLTQRMSKSLAGKPKALTMNCYLPVSLRFHSLSRPAQQQWS